MKLRIGSTADAPDMLRIALAAIAQSGYTEAQIVAWSQDFSLEQISQGLEGSSSIVAEIDDEVVGFATLIDHGETAGELDLFYVDPRFKRRGIGKFLVRAVEDRARQIEMTCIWVDGSSPAIHRLTQLGYHVHDSNKKTVNGVEFRNAWMLKRFN